MPSFVDVLDPPATVTVTTGAETLSLAPAGSVHSARDVVVETRPVDGALAIAIRAETTLLERVHLRWPLDLPPGLRILGDAWERGYGDLEWRGPVPERIMPWYFLAHDGQATHGCGVMTQPRALCFWMVDPRGVSLWLDVRSGGVGVALGGRTLEAARVTVREGAAGETPFASARAFCQRLCAAPRLPDRPVYGSNNWYYAVGHSSHAAILDDTRLLVSLAPGGDNRPFMVIDAGWQPRSGGERLEDPICGGPYTGGNPRFPNMPGLAGAMRQAGARPGLWIRPLAAGPGDPDTLLLPVERAIDATARARVLDPSLPEVLERVAADFHLLSEWGFELIKHDWATCDVLGRWGFQMGAALTTPGWRFNDHSRTTAEIILDLYRAIRRGAGSSLVIGCNTIGHLGAGLFELQRIGDDTSARDWERTRKYGVNSLAFRAPQHAAFFAADADCFGHTGQVPWELNARFLDLLARSGTPLFVSIAPAVCGPREAQALKAAFASAAQPQPLGEPLDWLDTTCPEHWRLGGETVRYDWSGAAGAQPVSASVPMWWGS
jgi:alpha-galactosidase